MAVRVLDLMQTDQTQLRVIETVLSRRDLRRVRHRWEMLGLALVAVPFIVAAVTLGMLR